MALQPPHAASCIPGDRAERCSHRRDLLGTVCEWSGWELDLVGDCLCPRLQAEGQGCDPWGTAPLPQVKPPASATWSTLHPRARIHLWAYGQEDQTASRTDKDGIISLYVLQGARAGVVQPPWTGCTPRGRQTHQPGDSPHHHLQAEYPASLCPGRMCFVTCDS